MASRPEAAPHQAPQTHQNSLYSLQRNGRLARLAQQVERIDTRYHECCCTLPTVSRQTARRRCRLAASARRNAIAAVRGGWRLCYSRSEHAGPATPVTRWPKHAGWSTAVARMTPSPPRTLRLTLHPHRIQQQIRSLPEQPYLSLHRSPLIPRLPRFHGQNRGFLCCPTHRNTHFR